MEEVESWVRVCGSISHGEQCRVLAAILLCPIASTWVSVLMIREEAPAYLGPKLSLKIVRGLSVKAICSNAFEVVISKMALRCRNSAYRVFALPKESDKHDYKNKVKATFCPTVMLKIMSNSCLCPFFLPYIFPWISFSSKANLSTYLSVEIGTLFLVGKN